MNPNVIALREEFHIPPDDDRFRVICTDGAGYVARLKRSKDVILADAWTAEGSRRNSTQSSSTKTPIAAFAPGAYSLPTCAVTNLTVPHT